MNKMIISLTVLGAIKAHMAFQPSVEMPVDEITSTVKIEYDSACVRKTVKLSGEFYTCKDLKKYLHKRGYE